MEPVSIIGFGTLGLLGLGGSGYGGYCLGKVNGKSEVKKEKDDSIAKKDDECKAELAEKDTQNEAKLTDQKEKYEIKLTNQKNEYEERISNIYKKEIPDLNRKIDIFSESIMALISQTLEQTNVDQQKMQMFGNLLNALCSLKVENQDVSLSNASKNNNSLHNKNVPINDAGEGSSAPLNSSSAPNNELFNPKAVA